MIRYRTEGICHCDECRGQIKPNTWCLTDGRVLFCCRECWDNAHDCDRFQLDRMPAKGPKPKPAYENNDAKPVKSLFPGSHTCLPGQSDLF